MSYELDFDSEVVGRYETRAAICLIKNKICIQS